jgi:hypothetical protein
MIYRLPLDVNAAITIINISSILLFCLSHSSGFQWNSREYRGIKSPLEQSLPNCNPSAGICCVVMDLVFSMVCGAERGLNYASGRPAPHRREANTKSSIIWRPQNARPTQCLCTKRILISWMERERNVQLMHHNNRAGCTVNPSIFHLNGTLMMKRHLICLQSGEQIHLQHFSSGKTGRECTRALMHKRRGSLSRSW